MVSSIDIFPQTMPLSTSLWCCCPPTIIQCLQPLSPMFILHRAYLNLFDLDTAILLAELINFWLPSIRLPLQRCVMCSALHNKQSILYVFNLILHHPTFFHNFTLKLNVSSSFQLEFEG